MRLYLYTQSKVFKQASWSLGVAVGLGLSADKKTNLQRRTTVARDARFLY